MYLFFLTMKTPNGIFSLCILLYTIILAILCPILRRKGKKAAVTVVLCVLPVIAALIHFGIYGTKPLNHFTYLYIEALLPLLLLIPGKNKIVSVLRPVI